MPDRSLAGRRRRQQRPAESSRRGAPSTKIRPEDGNTVARAAHARTEVKYAARESIFFLCYFLYVWLRINPALHYQRQNPVFLLGFPFFRQFLNHPGGPVEYAAAFLSQLYCLPMPGALLVTALAWAVVRCTAALIRSIRPETPEHLVHFVPALLLLALHSRYEHPLAITLGLAFSLLFTLCQLRNRRTAAARIATYLGAGLLLYYAAAGPFLLFALLCALYEAVCLRRPIVGAVYLAIAAAVPALATSTLFLLNGQMAYLHLLPFQELTRSIGLPHLLIAFFPFLFLIYHPVILAQLDHLKTLRLTKACLQYVPQTLLLFTALGLAGVGSFEKTAHLTLQTDYFARHEQWQALIRLSRQERSPLTAVAFQTNRALFHTGQLLEEMFSFPQSNDASSLMMVPAFKQAAPLQESDFCYDLGLINEARHCAYEAVTTVGETPWVLKRMAVVNFVSGDLRAAERCLNVLDKTLFFRDWARRFRQYLGNPALASKDAMLSHGQSMLARADFIVKHGHTREELSLLLTDHPNNKMAFEYRVARDLLVCQLGSLPADVAMLGQFGHRSIPRHVEEAMLGAWAVSGRGERPAVFQRIRPETLERFRAFDQVVETYRGDWAAAKPALWQQFRSTYWFYLVYNCPAARTAPKPSSEAAGIQ